MRETLKQLTRSGKQVVFVIDVPELGVESRFCDVDGKKVEMFGYSAWVRNPHTEFCFIFRNEFNARSSRYRELVKMVLQDFPMVYLFDPIDLFCNSDRCIGISDGRKLYRDADHLSGFGSVYVAEHLAPVIRKTLH